MSKKHDENQDIRILSKKFKIDSYRKTIDATKGQLIGNKTWGRLDYLCHYCDYIIVWNSGTTITKESYSNNNEKQELRNAKRESKQHQLTNKRK